MVSAKVGLFVLYQITEAVVKMGDKDYVERGEFNRLDERVTTLDIRQTRTEVRTDHIEKQMDSIHKNTTWILRIIISAIILALLGLIIV